MARALKIGIAAVGVALFAVVAAAGRSGGPIPPPPAEMAIAPAAEAHDVNPLSPITVTSRLGTLESVTVTNGAGHPIAGQLAQHKLRWQSTQPLGYDATYTVTSKAKRPNGDIDTKVSTFSTLRPNQLTDVELRNASGDPLREDVRYGVGTVVVATFSQEVADKASAERALSVTTDPPVTGSWYWLSDKEAHWRPERYYQAGTTVRAAANLYGIGLGDGHYGRNDARAMFHIGDAHVSIADDNTKTVTVFDNGKPVRTMPTSMGRGGTATVAGNSFHFWTQPGIYTVLSKADRIEMNSASYGLPEKSPLGYRQWINYATRISTDGIFLHQLDSTVWAQGNTNTSHGCLNLNGENARWFYDYSQPGDVVEVKHTGGDPLEVWQNGDWTVPWDLWRKGSALPQPSAAAQKSLEQLGHSTIR